MSKGSLSLKPFLLKAAQPYGTDLPTFTVFHNHKSSSSFSETYVIGKIMHINYNENNSFFHSAYSKLGGAVFDYNYNFIGFNVGYQTSDHTKAFAVTAEYIYNDSSKFIRHYKIDFFDLGARELNKTMHNNFRRT